MYTLPSSMPIDEFCEAIGFDIKNNDCYSFFWQAHKANSITISKDTRHYQLNRNNEKIILKSHKLNFTVGKNRCYTMDMDSFRALVKIYDKSPSSSCDLTSLFAKFDSVTNKYHRYLNYNQNKEMIFSQLWQHFERLSLELASSRLQVQSLSQKVDVLLKQSQPLPPPPPPLHVPLPPPPTIQCIALFRIDASCWKVIHRPFELFSSALLDLHTSYPAAELLKTWQIYKEYDATMVILMTIFNKSHTPYEYLFTLDEHSVVPSNNNALIKLMDKYFS